MKRKSVQSLATYGAKRDFRVTAEPPPKRPGRRNAATLSFGVQKHAARRLHYDFRLEWNGVLKSWAVPRGPSLDPKERRLAVQVEDHPLDYLTFQGTIPKEQYGGGEVLLWDVGTWVPQGSVKQGLEAGKLKFQLHGQKLSGSWMLVRLKGQESGKSQWLLIKEVDEAARSGPDADIVVRAPEGVGVQRRGRPRSAAAPEFISPQLATLVDEPPTQAGWTYEVKYDGYRMLARVHGDDIRIFSRNGHDWSARLPSLVREIKQLELGEVWLDGEIAVAGDDGVTRFQALQNALGSGEDHLITYHVFDLLHHHRQDLRAQPLAQRRRQLAKLLGRPNAAARIRLSESFEGDGVAILAKACALGFEGLIGKRVDGIYESGRTRSWIKLKCSMKEEFVIIGYTDPAGSRNGFGALLLGWFDEHGALQYAGRVGTGFSDKTLHSLHRTLLTLRQKRAGASTLPAGPDIHAVRPTLVAQVRFAGWTDDGVLRHAVFEGLRDDRIATSVRREQPLDVQTLSRNTGKPARRSMARHARRSRVIPVKSGVKITHASRVLFAKPKTTKQDLVSFYESVATHILPHLRARPLMLLRCPAGNAEPCFHQKHAMPGMPANVIGRGQPQHLVANDVDALITLIQFGAIELHTWGASMPALTHPDRMTFDLDPDPSVSWTELREAVMLTKTLLEALDLATYVKTTGGKGLHVVVPLARRQDWALVKSFSRSVARYLERAFPDRFTASLSKSKRTGKIFIDYLRNAEGATAVCAYSVRAREGAPVSVPIHWDELDGDVRGSHFNVRNVAKRVRELRADPWAGYEKCARSISQGALKRLADTS